MQGKWISIYLTALLLAGCGGSSDSGSEVSQVVLGEQLFFDTNLSLNRTMSCATCHDPEAAFMDARFTGDPGSNPVEGALSVGDDAVTLGGRNTPMATYALLAPAFGIDAEGNYVGGQFHDGRAEDLTAQAKGPFLDPAEMMMVDEAAVMARVQENPDYVSAFKALFGETIFDDVNAGYEALAGSIAAFEQTEVFATFDSKYDRFRQCVALREDEGACYEEGNWSVEEQAGYALFFSNNNTNCVSCHSLDSESESAEETFTNFKYENIGTPPNLANFAAKGIEYTPDLGLGGRDDINDSTHYGKIKVPSLRNVAVTAPYMSNGVFKQLRTVIAFYDHMAGQGNHPLNPETTKPWAAPNVNATVNRELLEATKELTDAKIDGLIAFLKTLTDKKFEHLIPEGM